jgi:hypothetical protein
MVVSDAYSTLKIGFANLKSATCLTFRKVPANSTNLASPPIFADRTPLTFNRRFRANNRLQTYKIYRLSLYTAPFKLTLVTCTFLAFGCLRYNFAIARKTVTIPPRKRKEYGISPSVRLFGASHERWTFT